MPTVQCSYKFRVSVCEGDNVHSAAIIMLRVCMFRVCVCVYVRVVMPTVQL